MDISVLLEEVKNYLDITWQDEATDRKLSGILKRGMVYLDSVAGGPQEYEEESNAKTLLFEYVRYVQSNALDEFSQNYLSELLALQIHEEVNAYDKEQSAEVS